MRPIWESASRPLFVRSVWQEAIGRRHFILDYEPRQRQRWKRQKKRPKGNYQQTQSCEEYEQSAEESIDLLDEYLLLDATKLTLQQQQQQSFPALGGRMNATSGSATTTALGSREQRQNSRQAKRRAWLLSRGKTYHLDHHLAEHQSRRSSLQDPSTPSMTANNPEERLAERVLHWLDLAGRTDIVKEATAQPVTSSAQVARANQRSQRIHQRGVSLKRVATAAGSGSHQRSMVRKPSAKPQQPSTHTVGTCSSASASASASANANAKPITIIFNKEGIPVRLNRPARNIDLCALSSSASATRRLAGQLASARLYSGAAASPSHSDETRTPPHSSRGMSGAGLGSSVNIDSRKQLHIFMPSLPKKGLLAAAAGAGSGEDALSVSFSMSVSDEDSSVGSPFKPSTPTPTGQERTKGGRPGPENLRHQHSFEARYSSIIQKQIWETSINKDVLERQLNAYLPFSRSASLTKDGSGGFDSLMPSDSAKARSLSTTPTRRLGPCLEKLEAVDIAEHQAVGKAKP